MIVLELGEEKHIALDQEEKEELKARLELFIETQDPKSYHYNFNQIDSSISNNADLYHANYLDYLNHAWTNHYGIIFSPDICWYTIMCELTKHIKSNNTFYNSYFRKMNTDDTLKIGKEDNNHKIPFYRIRRKLRDMTPISIEVFLPEFSTSTENSVNSFCLTFFESMGSYYKFRNVGCGIPKVSISGTRQDWELIRSRVSGFSKMFTRLEKHFIQIEQIVDSIIKSFDNPDKGFWKQIFRSNPCGQGKNIDGWITKLYNYNFEDRQDFPNHISGIYYTGSDDRDKFKLSYGLFQSKMNDHGFLDPQFGYVLHRLSKKVNKTTKQIEDKSGEKKPDPPDDDDDASGFSGWSRPGMIC